MKKTRKGAVLFVGLGSWVLDLGFGLGLDFDLALGLALGLLLPLLQVIQ